MMKVTRKKARRTTVEVREAARGVAVVGEGVKENKRRRLMKALDRCVGVNMDAQLGGKH